MIRPARASEIPRLREIERAAGTAFRDLRMDAVADDEPPSATALSAFIDGGRCWVAVGPADEAVAYCLVHVIDDAAHVEQVSVHPDHARRGVGRALIDRADTWAGARALSALILTTFAEVPWNRLYYERLGFRVVPDGSLGGGLRHVRAQEAATGLDRWPRVAMRWPVRVLPVVDRGDLG